MNINDIHPNPTNPRLIKDDKFKKLVASVKDFPKMMELRPIIVDDTMTILGGNMRYKALQEAGFTEIPDEWVKQAKDLTEEQKKEFIVKDNLPFGEWNWDVLANDFEIKDLLDWGFDEKDLKIEQEVVEDEVPEVSNEPAISKLGEVYQLGRHRLMCGDSTKIEDVEKLMNGQKADMVFTDPPYNIGLEYHNYDDKKDDAEFEQIIKDSYSNAITVLNTPAHFIFTYKVKGIPEMLDWCKDIGLDFRHIAVWHNPQRKAGSYPGMWGYSYEPIMDFTYGGWRKLNNSNGVGYGDVYIEDSPIKVRKGNDEYHPAQKPMKVWTDLAKLCSDNDENILDTFGGSGSTLIACEQTNRTCYMAEIDGKYCDVIRKRYWKFTHNGSEEGWQDGTKAV